MKIPFFNIYIVRFILLFTVISSCSTEVKRTYISGGAFSESVKNAKKTDRGIILISGAEGCSMCEHFEAELIRDDNFAKTIYKSFVVQRVNSNKMGDQWLSRLLNTPEVPVYIFMDKELNINAIKTGFLRAEQTQNILEDIKMGKVFIDDSYKYGGNIHLSPPVIRDYLNSQFHAQYIIDQYEISQDINDYPNNIIDELKENNKILPSFYNNYLLSRNELILGDTVLAEQWAQLALEDLDPVTLYFNGPLRVELKTLLDKQYSIYDDPYIGIDRSEIQLGLVPKNKAIDIPIQIKNIGKKPLIIHDIFTSCGCTIVEEPAEPIGPGTTRELNAKIVPEGLGEFGYFIVFRSNAINTPLQFYINGRTID